MSQIDDAAAAKSEQKRKRLHLIARNTNNILSLVKIQEYWGSLYAMCQEQDIFNIKNSHVKPQK